MLSPVDPSLDLSISIVSYNVRDLLDECLRSIAAQTRGVRYEIIVVDNGSADGTVEMLRRNHPSARVITNRVNLGFAAAQNIGLRAGRGRYLYALDSDTYLKTDAFAEMVRFMDEQPSAGAAGARLLSPDGTRPAVQPAQLPAVALAHPVPRHGAQADPAPVPVSGVL